MSNINMTHSIHSTFRMDAIADGYVYECSCGELYKGLFGAAHCRKCRTYCVFGYCTHVTDIRTGEVVWGEVPSQAAFNAAAIEAEARWAEERAQLEFTRQMWAQEGELYEAEMERQRVEAQRVAAELLEDQLYAIQDSLMNVA